MSSDGSLDLDIVQVVIDNADELAETVKEVNQPIIDAFNNMKEEYEQISGQKLD
ncbi:MAG TPA: hypothetical protein VJY37_00955 [Anaerovoracaceae bacterium]|nr:hypothetical protein [Anaerovoracaceae bacterium]